MDRAEFEKQINDFTQDGSDGIIKSNIIPMKLQFFAEKGLSEQSTNTIKKSIDKIKKAIADHENYIKYPEKYADDWQTRNEQGKQGLIEFWKKEIANQNQQIINRLEELEKRGEKYE